MIHDETCRHQLQNVVKIRGLQTLHSDRIVRSSKAYWAYLNKRRSRTAFFLRQKGVEMINRT